MNILDAVKITRAELDKHGLVNVSVVVNGRLTRAFGRYRYSVLHSGDKRIELSKKLVELNDEARVLKTILHEVAHALTEGHSHDHVWQAKCIEIGGDGIPRYSIIDTNIPERKIYKLACSNCSYSGGRYYRKMQGYSHRGCGGSMKAVAIN